MSRMNYNKEVRLTMYDYMIKNNMIFLKNGIIVNKDFDKFFKLSDRENEYGHILYSKDYGCYILTSGLDNNLFNIQFDVPCCQIFLINPLFMDYYVCDYGYNVAYVYDKYLDKFYDLFDDLREYYGFNVFIRIRKES